MLGVGATVGTGIFFVMHEAVPLAGPAVIISFLLAGLAAGLSALCYAEMASAVPISGSTYSYAYATLGELVADGGRRVPDARVRRVDGSRVVGLERLPQPAARRSVRLADPGPS